MSTNEPSNAREAAENSSDAKNPVDTTPLTKEPAPSPRLQPTPQLQPIPLTPPLEPNYRVERTIDDDEPQQARIGTVVWGLIVIALAALLVISTLGWVVLDGTYVLIGLMIGAGAALVIGGLLAARKSAGKPKSPAK
ncbi:hypothetical protein ACTAQJ_23160 [Arthrobacter sp. alpha11c]